MKGRRLLALSALAIVLGCEGSQQPTGPTVPVDPSKILSDGAHGGNPNFFFLPPLVPNPVNDPNFERGKANNALQPSLTVEICELIPEPLNALPTPDTHCVVGDPVKTFPAGTVRQVGLPQSQTGWWTVHSPPADGFYYVLWDTQQSNLTLTSFYRIKVLVDIGRSKVLLGVADVDPVSNMREWRHTLTGQVIQVIDDRLLPIPFRVENGGLCYGVTNCTEAVVTNDNPTGDYQIVRVEGGAGPIAGALFPDGWLPAAGPQSVVVTINQVNTGGTNPDGTQAIPCHQGLPLQQFNGCFNFTTFPKLQPISVSVPGHQFELPGVTTAVCFTLLDTQDPREPFVQLWSSGPSEPAHPLVSRNDALILTSPASRNCNTSPIVRVTNNANALTRVASAGWQRLKGGLGRVFGVQTAYAVDLGLGGLTFDFSNIGPALTAQIQRYTSTGLTLGPGSTTTSTARIVGTQVHNGGSLTTGIGGLPVTFTVAAGNGTLRLLGSEAAPATEVTVITDTNGFASVNWTMPATGTGPYTLTADGPATGGPVTFTATVVGVRQMLSMQTGATFQIAATPPDVFATWLNSNPTAVSVSTSGLVTAIAGGEDIAGLNGANLTSVLTSGSPGPTVRVNTVFDIFPRMTTLAWAPVNGAASYDIQIEFGNTCTGFASCNLWSTHSGVTTTALSYTFGFVGAQPGRWHVISRDANGSIIPGSFDVQGVPIPGSPSPWVYFRYNI